MFCLQVLAQQWFETRTLHPHNSPLSLSPWTPSDTCRPPWWPCPPASPSPPPSPVSTQYQYTLYTHCQCQELKKQTPCKLSAVSSQHPVSSPLCGGVMQIKLLRPITMIMMAALREPSAPTVPPQSRSGV